MLVAVYCGLGIIALRSGTDVAALFDLTRPQSLGSAWNYAKFAVSAAALLLAAKLHRDAGLGLFAVTAIVLLTDDFFELHDMAAWKLGHYFEQTPIEIIHQQSRGEPIVFAIFGAFVLALMALAYRKTKIKIRPIAQALIVSLLLFAFFAAVIDLLHGFSELFFVQSKRAISGVFNVIEEGGEFFSLSVLATVCIWLSVRTWNDNSFQEKI
ncbi:MAG: hypothetical protein ACR2O1_02065 [Boseongicola sp.]